MNVTQQQIQSTAKFNNGFTAFYTNCSDDEATEAYAQYYGRRLNSENTNLLFERFDEIHDFHFVCANRDHAESLVEAVRTASQGYAGVWANYDAEWGMTFCMTIRNAVEPETRALLAYVDELMKGYSLRHSPHFIKSEIQGATE
jgi:hypothetical protein